MKTIYPGQSVMLRCTFTLNSTPTDPTAISLKVTAPGGTTSEYTYALGQVTREGAGVYAKNVTLTTEGTWLYRWSGTGTVEAPDEGEIQVERSEFV